MATQFVGVNSSTLLRKGSLLRLAFSERYSVQLDRGFAGRFEGVYTVLPTKARLIPTTPGTVPPGRAEVVIDARLQGDRTASELAYILDELGGSFVKLDRLELLGVVNSPQDARQTPGTTAPPKVRNSGTEVGAAERDQVRDQVQKDNADTSLAGQALRALRGINSTVKWAALLLLLLLLAWFVIPRARGFRNL